MSAATTRRRRTETIADPGDHRAAAVATVKAITQRAADIWGGADGMAEYAWCLLDTAASLGERLVERNEPVVVDHAGGLACDIRHFHAVLHGVRALIMEFAEKDWSADDKTAMAFIKTAGLQLRDVLANLERQRHWEVGLGNKPAILAEVEEVGEQTADAWSPCAYAKEVAAALMKETSEPIFGVLAKTTARALEAIQDSGAAPADERIAARAAAELEEAHALALHLRRNHEVSLLEGATEMLLKVAIDQHRAARRQIEEAA
nr:hypothetical protein [Variovorax boronicumulans]